MPSPTQLPSGYAPLLAELKDRVRAGQVRAALNVNRELLLLYWHVGMRIVVSRRTEKWGAGVVKRLACDLQTEFPGMSGLSERNLKYMAAFAEAWPELPIGQQPAAQLPWGHNIVLLDKLQRSDTREWYARRALADGWSRAILEVQIDTRFQERQGKAITNFRRILPPSQSDLAQQLLKDPYTFDFLTIDGDAKERELESALVDQVQKLLLELGLGFAFVGRQVRLDVEGDEFRIDLLFYHLKLRCFVVVDLKARPFAPAFAGQLNFYLAAVDAQMRHADDAPTIGLLLTRGKNRTVVEYALRGITSPMGVAEWTTSSLEALPAKLQRALPSIEQLEWRLPATPQPP